MTDIMKEAKSDVSTAEDEIQIDLKEVNDKLADIEKNILKYAAEHN
ncbi:hypothetical protein [Flavivirga sp. 57AJ16]|nr:hypothetical protein [Flavivirga sp. 57AJ16]MDD7885735.1 hypothetical protein [Flavivirga sp. 57AJ16]